MITDVLTPSDRASKYNSQPILDKQWIALANTAETEQQVDIANERFNAHLTHQTIRNTCISLIFQESHTASYTADELRLTFFEIMVYFSINKTRLLLRSYPFVSLLCTIMNIIYHKWLKLPKDFFQKTLKFKMAPNSLRIR